MSKDLLCNSLMSDVYSKKEKKETFFLKPFLHIVMHSYRDAQKLLASLVVFILGVSMN